MLGGIGQEQHQPPRASGPSTSAIISAPNRGPREVGHGTVRGDGRRVTSPAYQSGGTVTEAAARRYRGGPDRTWDEPADQHARERCIRKEGGGRRREPDRHRLHVHRRRERADDWRRALVPNDVVVATKGGYAPGHGQPEVLGAQIERSLRRLRTESIPLYHMHRVH